MHVVLCIYKGILKKGRNCVKKRIITLPFKEEDISSLESGDNLLLSGTIFTARDAAHKRLVDVLQSGRELPVDLKGQVIYYAGPTPAPPGKVIGSAGPTTSFRMDVYTPHLLKLGLKGMIGKGGRSLEVKEALKKYRAVYMAAVGGAGALLSQKIISAEVVAYEDLGPEAIGKLVVEDFPAVVINDIYGRDLYEEGKNKFKIN